VYLDCDFGALFSGLSTVGYELRDAAGQTVIARTTAGVIDLGGGAYGADVAIPVGFVGSIRWTPSVGADIQAVERVDLIAEVDAWLDRSDAIEVGITPRQALRGIVALLFGQIATAGTPLEKFKNPDGTAVRVTISVDNSGNRSSVTLDL
jgi:hypothetical protein